MAVKASATVTLSSVVDVKSVWRYYKLQASTLSKPSKPTTNPPSGWTTTEPSYTDGSTNSLYFCDLTVFCDNTFAYSDVSLSSSYEAAKAAYNKAVAADDKAQDAKDTANNAQNQLDKKGLREYVIDLLDTDTYATDTYYPVVGTSIPATGYHTFEVNNQLRPNTAPSWSTHTSTKGFTCNLSVRMIGCDWGVVADHFGWIDNASYAWCDKMPAYIQQISSSSYPVFYLRGGGKYYVYTDYACTWSIKKDTYTVNNQSVEPTKTPSNWSKLVNNWDVVTRVTNAETSITNNQNEIKLKATKTEVTEVKSTADTAKSTADSAKTAASNAQTTANNATTAASNAQSTADTAKTNAATAQSTADSVKNNLANNYSTTAQIAETYTTQTEFTQTSEEIRMDFTKSITSASNDLQSQITANNTATNQKLSEINKYIRFVDGKIVLGETGSELTLTVQNDRVSFQQAGNEVAYFSNNNLYIRRAEVLTTLRIGNYEWAPRNDGGLALRKRGI